MNKKSVIKRESHKIEQKTFSSKDDCFFVTFPQCFVLNNTVKRYDYIFLIGKKNDFKNQLIGMSSYFIAHLCNGWIISCSYHHFSSINNNSATTSFRN